MGIYKDTGKTPWNRELQAIVETIDFIIGLRKQSKDDYIQNVTELSKAYSLCSTTDIAEEHNIEIGFHKSVRAGLIKIVIYGEKKHRIN